MIESTAGPTTEPSVLVLGVGNLLLRDEGFGVHTIQTLARDFDFSANVLVRDGGTAGLALLDEISTCDHLILVDVIRSDAPAGTLVRLSGEQLQPVLAAKQSAHDWTVTEVLLQAQLIGRMPETVILAVVPEDMTTWGTDLSPRLQSVVPEMIGCVLKEIVRAGGRAWAKAPSAPEAVPLEDARRSVQKSAATVADKTSGTLHQGTLHQCEDNSGFTSVPVVCRRV
jgi:hydrogenase maturation protease